jgi:hypothetical protein
MSVTQGATFEASSLTWHDGAFVLCGDWADEADGLGRVRLLVDVEGRRRNIGASGGKTAGGIDWRATFVCAHEPDPDAYAALKVGEQEIELPSPEFGPPPEEQEAGTLIEQIRAERAALDRARHSLARERKAAEEAEARLNAARRRLGGTPEPARTTNDVAWLGWVVGIAIAILFLLVLTWVL